MGKEKGHQRLTFGQIDFPSFVAELAQGVFQAIVDAIIQQMDGKRLINDGLVQSVEFFLGKPVGHRTKNRAKILVCKRKKPSAI